MTTGIPKLGCDKCQALEPVLASAMTLRDYFAVQAMQAYIPLYEHNPHFNLCGRVYNLADAMLLAREVK